MNTLLVELSVCVESSLGLILVWVTFLGQEYLNLSSKLNKTLHYIR